MIKYVNSSIQSKNIFYVKNLLIQTGTELNSNTMIEIDIILLLKLLETYLFRIYMKDMNHIIKTIKILNVGDFIIRNLFLYAEVYDHTRSSIKNFKEKVNWNFCEISASIYNPLFPKFFKKTIYRHLNYIPNDDSFLYNVVQYYYNNKDYQKANLLVNKIISKEDKTELTKDTHSICYLMLINIKINKESYGEALDLAICNIERLKEIKEKRKNFNVEILHRNYFVLGFCYSKLADNTINYEEKNKYNQLALAGFKMALDGNMNNQYFIYHYARQLYELKYFAQAEEILAKLDEGRINSSNLNIINYARALKVLINIALLKFDLALSLCNQFMKSIKEIRALSIIITLKYYLEIYRHVSLSANATQTPDDEQTFLNKLSMQCEQICNGFDQEVANVDSFISKYSLKVKKSDSKFMSGNDMHRDTSRENDYKEMNKISQGNKEMIQTNFKQNAGVNNNMKPSYNYPIYSESQLILKELVKSLNIEGSNHLEIIEDEELKPSSKIYLNEKKNLENAKIDFLKNFFIIEDILRSNGLDKDKFVVNKLSNLVFKSFGTNEDLNMLIIVSTIYNI